MIVVPGNEDVGHIGNPCNNLSILDDGNHIQVCEFDFNIELRRGTLDKQFNNNNNKFKLIIPLF